MENRSRKIRLKYTDILIIKSVCVMIFIYIKQNITNNWGSTHVRVMQHRGEFEKINLTYIPLKIIRKPLVAIAGSIEANAEVATAGVL